MSTRPSFRVNQDDLDLFHDVIRRANEARERYRAGDESARVEYHRLMLEAERLQRSCVSVVHVRVCWWHRLLPWWLR